MIVDRAFMVALRKIARDYCGGYQHKLEVQTWGGRVDIGDMTEQEQDEADISHFDLFEGVELPDNADTIDISVWGVEFKGGHPQEDCYKLGYVMITIENGKITAHWQ